MFCNSVFRLEHPVGDSALGNRYGGRVIEKLKLLWVDFTISPETVNPPSEFEEIFSIHRCGRVGPIRERLEAINFDAVCFDFDYPDRTGLRFIQKIKQEFSYVPMIMATVHHSEEVAIWAFRSGLFDYLVKPVPWADLEYCEKKLQEIRAAKMKQHKRKISGTLSKLPAEVLGSHKRLAVALLPAIYYVEKNYHRDFNNQDIANLCGMSPYEFSRSFKREFGLSFRDYVVRYRLRKAYYLLQSSEIAVKDVAYSVGFHDTSYFSRIFRRHLGMPPSAMARLSADIDSAPSSLAELGLPERLL